jgi:transcriptional regulator with XRE-family HTH domain
MSTTTGHELIAKADEFDRTMKLSGWSNRSLAKHVGISPSHLSRIKHGEPTSPETAKAIARAMKGKRYFVFDLFNVVERGGSGETA